MAVGLLALAAVALYIFGERTYLHVSRTGRRVYWALTAAAGAAALAEAAARIDIAWLVLSAVRKKRILGERERERKEGEKRTRETQFAPSLSFDGLPRKEEENSTLDTSPSLTLNLPQNRETNKLKKKKKKKTSEETKIEKS